MKSRRFCHTRFHEVLDRRLLMVATVRGSVFEDANGDGSLTGETLPVWTPTIYADYDYDGTLDPGEPSTTQATPQTSYSLTLPSTGTYLIRVNMPTTYAASFPQTGWQLVSVRDGLVTLGVNFGGYRTGRYNARPFDDLDRNGVYEFSDLNLRTPLWADLNRNGLFEDNEPSVDPATNGIATINLRPGSFLIRAGDQPGRTQTTAPNGSEILIDPSVTNIARPLAFNVTRFVRASAFRDLNGNGALDVQDAPITGATAFIDLNNNRLPDTGEPSALTGSNGGCIVTSAATFPINTNFLVQLPNGLIASSSYGLNGQSASPDMGFCAFPVLASNEASGILFVDSNNNGNLDSAPSPEKPLPGTTVWADVNGNTLLDPGEPTAQTDVAGVFRFAVPSGTYSIRIQLGTDYSPNINGLVFPATAFGGNAARFMGFRGVVDNRPTRSRFLISGQLYDDRNGNNLPDPGEPSLPGLGVFLDRNYNGVPDPGEESATTNAAGLFSVREVPTGWSDPLRFAPAAGWRESRPGGILIDLGSGALGQDAPIGLRRTLAVAPTTAQFNVDDQQSLRVDFSHDLGTSLQAGDFVLESLLSGQYVPTQALFSLTSSLVAGRSSALLRLPQTLPNGQYRLRLLPGAVHDAALRTNATWSLDFHILAGDANRDRAVNFADLLILAQNYGQSSRTFSQGDFNYDGSVNFSDLLIIAAGYNSTLASMTLPQTATRPSTRRRMTPLSVL
jgi:hypothetical protein